MADSGDDEVERICLGFDNLGLLKCKNPAFERTYYCKEHQKSPHGHIHVLYWGIPWLVLGGYLFLADLYDLFIPVPVFITGFILSFGLLFYEMVTRIYHWRIIDKNQSDCSANNHGESDIGKKENCHLWFNYWRFDLLKKINS